MNPVAELLAELVEADSTNPTLSEGGAGEAQVARILAQRLERAGLEVDVWDAAPGRPNVVGRLRGTGEGRTLMFCGHTDVVDAEPSQFAPVVRDGRMHGRGTNDMKGGIAASVIVAERLAAGPRLAGDVLMAFVIDEEWASLGAEALIGRYQADGAVLPEQSDLDVVIAHGGFAWYEVTSLGVESAGGEPEKGIDGIALAGPLLTGIVELDRELEGRVASLPYPNDGRPNIHASTIRGGQTYPTYPAECVIQIERCIMPGESLAESYAELEALLERARSRRSPIPWELDHRHRPRAGHARPRRAGGAGNDRRGQRNHRRGSRGQIRLRVDGFGRAGRGRNPVRRLRPPGRRRAHRRRMGRSGFARHLRRRFRAVRAHLLRLKVFHILGG